MCVNTRINWHIQFAQKRFRQALIGSNETVVCVSASLSTCQRLSFNVWHYHFHIDELLVYHVVLGVRVYQRLYQRVNVCHNSIIIIWVNSLRIMPCQGCVFINAFINVSTYVTTVSLSRRLTPYFACSVRGTWLGASDVQVKGVFRWTDNTLLNWTNWAESQPDWDTNASMCIYAESNDLWISYPCTGVMKPFACQSPAGGCKHWEKHTPSHERTHARAHI